MIETRRELMCDTCGRSGGDHAVFNLGHPFYNAEAQAQFHGTPVSPLSKEQAREPLLSVKSGGLVRGFYYAVLDFGKVTAKRSLSDNAALAAVREVDATEKKLRGHIAGLESALSTAIAERDEALADARHCTDCDRPEVCDVIRRGTGPCGKNAGVIGVVCDIMNRTHEQLSTSQERVRELEKDAARWHRVKPGLFVTPHRGDDGEIEVVFQSGSLDEVAARLYHTLTQNERGIVWDITPIVDAALSPNTQRETT